MNVFDKIAICTFLLAILVWQALHQSHTFKQQKTISHFWKGIWYGLSIGLITTPYVFLYGWWYLLKIPLLGILERMALFDFILNAARSKPLFYNGEESTGSLIDRLENQLSEEALPAYKTGWLVIFILYVIGIK